MLLQCVYTDKHIDIVSFAPFLFRRATSSYARYLKYLRDGTPMHFMHDTCTIYLTYRAGVRLTHFLLQKYSL